MFILDALGPINTKPPVSNVTATGNDVEQVNLDQPIKSEDSFDGTLPLTDSPFSDKPGLRISRRKTKEQPPVPKVVLQLIAKLTVIGFGEDESRRLAESLFKFSGVIQNKGSINLTGFSGLTQEAINERIQIVLKQLGKLQDDFKTAFFSDKKNRDMERVFIALSFAAADPIGTISTLGSLSLTDPAAIAFAKSSISDIGSFAARWFQEMAKKKGDNSYAVALANALQGAAGSALNAAGPSNSTSQPTEIYALGPSGNIVGVVVPNRSIVTEPVLSDSTLASAAQRGDVALTESNRLAKQRQKVVEAAVQGRDTLTELAEELRNNSDPLRQVEIVTSQETQKKIIGQA